MIPSIERLGLAADAVGAVPRLGPGRAAADVDPRHLDSG